jgi:hypothetical protein
MNDVHVYSIWTYEKKISYDYYCQIVAHEVCDVVHPLGVPMYILFKIKMSPLDFVWITKL